MAKSLRVVRIGGVVLTAVVRAFTVSGCASTTTAPDPVRSGFAHVARPRLRPRFPRRIAYANSGPGCVVSVVRSPCNRRKREIKRSARGTVAAIGRAASEDTAETFKPMTDAPLLYLVDALDAASGGGFIGVDTGETMWHSRGIVARW